MKSLFYTLFLLAVMVACVVLLHSIDSGKSAGRYGSDGAPVIGSYAPHAAGISNSELENMTAEDMYAVGTELLNLWHVREATGVFERAAGADSLFYRAWVRLVECYSHPLVGGEDQARQAWENAWQNRLSDADTLFLRGLRFLFIEHNFAAAADRLDRAEKTEVNHEDAVYYAALAAYKTGEVAHARKKLEDLLNRDDTVGRVVELSILCDVNAGDFEAAEDQARNLARAYSEEPFPYVLLAQIALFRGNTSEAVEFCNNALILDAKYIPAILVRSNLYAARGQIEPARVSFEKLLLFEDPVLRAAGMEGIGFVDFLSGSFDDGLASMDEAIRLAMLAGAVRRGLFYANKLVEYLCELGQADAADAVVDRWITGFGDVPVNLGRLRIHILNGEFDTAKQMLVRMDTDDVWGTWMEILAVDSVEMSALTRIGTGEHEAALAVLNHHTANGSPDALTRMFLSAYAAFENGDAESASRSFAEVRTQLLSVEFPYHGDPILFVQSFFYLAETFIASGREAEANTHYESFLDYWGEADWEIQAVNRAVEKTGRKIGEEPSG